jgi:hypothetical protein
MKKSAGNDYGHAIGSTYQEFEEGRRVLGTQVKTANYKFKYSKYSKSSFSKSLLVVEFSRGLTQERQQSNTERWEEGVVMRNSDKSKAVYVPKM